MHSVKMTSENTVILLLEVLWPLLIFVVVAVVRQGAPPVAKPTCHYAARAVPSAGMLPFLQSYVCNLNNACQTEAEVEEAQGRMDRLTGLVNDLGPHLSNPNVTNALNSLKNGTSLLKALNSNLKNESWLQDYMKNGIPLRELFRDPDELRRLVVTENRYIEGAVFDTILNASVSIDGIFRYFDGFEGSEVVCNASRLENYIMFEEGVDVSVVSAHLCSVNETQIPKLFEVLQQHLDVVKIVRFLARVPGEYGLRNAFNDLSLLLDLILNSPAVRELLPNIPQLFDIVDVLKNVPDWVDKFKQLMHSDTHVFKDIVTELDPIVRSLSEGSTIIIWDDIKEGVLMVDNFISMFFGGRSSGAGGGAGQHAVVDWFDDPGAVQNLLKLANVSEASIILLMNKEVTYEELTGYFLAKEAKDLLPLFCPHNASADLDFICKEHGHNARGKAFEHLINLSRFKEEALQVVIERTSPVEVFIEKGVEYLGKVVNLPPDIMNILSSVFSVNVEDSLKTLQLMFSGSTDGQDVIRLLSGSLGGLDAALSNLPYANMLMAVLDTCLSTATEAINTLTDVENYLVRLLEEDLHVVASIRNLLALGPDATKAVLNAFTDPQKLQILLNETQDIRSLYCNADRFSQFLDMQRSDTLDRIIEIFCSDNITTISQNIIQKLHLNELQQIFTEGMDQVEVYFRELEDPSSSRFNISSLLWKSQAFYNSVLNAGQTISRDWGAFIQGLANVDMHTAQWKSVWSDFHEDVWAAGFAVMVRTWGPVVEESELWPVVGPSVHMVDTMMRNYKTDLSIISDVFGSNSGFGQLMVDMIKYAPEMMEVALSVAENPVVITTLVNSEDIRSVICNPEELRSLLTIPEDMPFDEMVNTMCEMDINQDLIVNFIPVFENQIIEINKTLGTGTAERFDWAQMVENGYELYKLSMDPMGYTEVITEIALMNITEMSMKVEKYWKRMESLSTQEVGRLAAFAVSYGTQIDRMLTNNSIWRVVKHYIYGNGLYLQPIIEHGFFRDILDLYPNATKLNALVMSIGQAVPDILQAVSNSVMHPFKLIEALMSVNTTDMKVCKGLKITSLLDVENPANLEKLETTLCSLDWMEIATEMSENPRQQGATKALIAILSGEPVPDISLNWMEIVHGVYTYFSMLSSFNDTSLPDIQGFGFNLTAIESRFHELLNASMKYKDPTVLSRLSVEFLLSMDKIATKDESLAAIWKTEKVFIYILNQLIGVANQNLQRFQGQDEVNILTFIHSEELDKIAKAVEASPDVVHVLLDTILDIMADSTTAAKFGNVQALMQVCRDQGLFESFFPEAARVKIDIRGTVCNVSLVNTTKLIQELQDSMAGLNQMIQAVSRALEPGVGIEDIHLNGSALMRNTDLFVRLLTDLTQNPPRIDLGIGTQWMNETVWQDLLLTYGDKLQQTFEELSTMGYGDLYNLTLAMIEQQLVQFIVYPEFNEIMAILGHTARRAITSMDTLLDGNTTSLKTFLKDYPTMERVFELSNSLPEIVVTLTYTNSFNPMALTAMLQTVNDWDSFCKVDISRFIQNVPGLTFDMTTFHSDLCALNITQLTAEAEAFTGTTDLMSTKPIANVTSDMQRNFMTMRNTVQDLGRLFMLQLQVIEHPPLHLQTVFSWLNQTVWETSFTTLGHQLSDPSTTLRMLASLDQLVPLLDNLSRTDELMGYMWKAAKIEMLMMNEFLKLANKNMPRFQGKVNLLDFFQSEELEKIAKVLKASPDIVKLLFDTILDILADPKKFTGFTDPQKFAQICMDDRSFTDLFPEAMTSVVDIQGVICNVTLVNVTHLVTELQDGVYGLSQMVHTLTRALQPNSSLEDLNVSYKSMAKNYQLYMELLINLTRSRVEIDPGLGEEWYNATTWNHLWAEFNRGWADVFPLTSGIADVVDRFLPVLETQLSMFYNNSEFSTTLASMDQSFQITLRVLQLLQANTSAANLADWSEYPQIQRLFHLLDQVPYMLLSLLDPQTAGSFEAAISPYFNVEHFSEFCSLDHNLTKLLPGLPNTEGLSPEAFKQQLCQLNITALGVESLNFVHIRMGKSLGYFVVNTSDGGMIAYSRGIVYDVTVSDVLRSFAQMVETYQHLLQKPLRLSGLPVFNVTLWDKWFSKLAARYQHASAENLLDLALNLRPMLQAILANPPARDMSPQLLRGLEGLVTFLNDFIRKLQVGKLPDLWKSFEELPSIQSLLQMSDMAPEVVDVILETLMDPVKSTRLLALIANPNATLGTFCNLTNLYLDYIFVVPENSSVSLLNVQSLICSLDFNMLGPQLQNITNAEYGFITDLILGSQQPGNMSVNFTDFINDVVLLQSTLNNLASDTGSLQQMNISNYFPFYTLFLGETWQPLYDKLAAKLTANPASVFDILYSMKPVLGSLLMDPVSGPATVTALQGVDGMMAYLTGYFTMLQEGRISDPLAVLKGSPNLYSMLTLLDQTPELTEVLIETMLSPTKSQAFISLFAVQPGQAFDMFCSTPDLSAYFEKPDGSAVNLDAVRQTVCSIKLVEIGEELANASSADFGFITQMLMPPMSAGQSGNVTFDVEQFYQHVEAFQSAFNNLTLHPPNGTAFTMTEINNALPFLKWFDTTRWSQMFDRVYQRMTRRPYDPVWIAEVGDQLLGSLSANPQGEIGTVISVINILMEEFGILLDKFQLLEGRPVVRLSQLFPESPTLRQMLDYLDAYPQLVEMILTSLETPQFAALLSMPTVEQAFLGMCQHPQRYFTLPPQSGQTVQTLVEGFCDVNITSLISELEAELHVPALGHSNSTHYTFNLTEYILVTQRLTETWSKQALPGLTVNPSWTNETFWTEVFTRYAQLMTDPAQEVAALMKDVLPLILPLNDTSFQAISVVMDEVTRMITDKLTELTNGTLSLDTLFGDAPRVKRLLSESLGIAPDLLHAVFSATIKSPDALFSVINSEDWRTRLCAQPLSLQAVFNLPASINSTEVQRLACSINETLLTADFMNLLGIDKIMAKLEALRQGRLNIDWEQVFADSSKLSTAIEQIIRHPPQLGLPVIDMQAMDRIAQTILHSFSDPNFALTSFAKVMNILEQFLNGTESWEIVTAYYKASEVIVEYMNGILRRLTEGGRTVNLESLFGESPQLRGLLDLAFHMGPDFIRGFLSASVKPEMIAIIATGKFDPATQLCSESDMRRYFDFHPSFNLSYAVSALCHINSSQILAELSNLFNVQHLGEQLAGLGRPDVKFDPMVYISQTQEFSENLIKLFNKTGLSFGNVDVIQYMQFNGSVDALLQNSLLMAISSNVTDFASQLQMMMPLIENTEFWKMIRPVFNAVNIFADAINKKLTIIESEPITLENLLKNATHLRKLLENTFGLAPDVVSFLLQSSADSNALTSLVGSLANFPELPDFSNMTLDELLNYTFPTLEPFTGFPAGFCPLDLLDVPPMVNRTAVRDVLCKINDTVLLQELKHLINYDKILAEFIKIGQNITEPFSWRVFLKNLQTLEQKLGQLPNINISVPVFPDFLTQLFSYNGDMQQWLQRLEQAAFVYSGDNFDGLEFLKIYILNGLSVWPPDGNPNEMMVRVLTASQKILSLVEGQLRAVEAVNLKTLFKYSEVTVDPRSVLTGDPDIVEKFLSTNFRPTKLRMLMHSPDRDQLLCDGSVDLVFDLPETVPPPLMSMFTDVFCNRSSPAYSVFQRALSTHYVSQYMVDALSRVIGAPDSISQNNTEVIDRAKELLDMIIPWQTGPHQFSPAFNQLLKFWEYQVPKFNAKLFAAGINVFLSLFERGSAVHSDWSRIGEGVQLVVEFVTSLTHSFIGTPVELSSLYRDNPQLLQLLNSSLTLNKEFTRTLYGGRLKLNKLLPLLSRPDGQEEFCQMATFTDVFEFDLTDVSVSPSELRDALCENIDQLLPALAHLLNPDLGILLAQLTQLSPMTPVVNWESLYLKMDTLVVTLLDLSRESTHDLTEMMLQHWTGSSANAPDILHKLMSGDSKLVSNLLAMIGQSLGPLDTNRYLYPIFQYLDGPVLQQLAQQVKMYKGLFGSDSNAISDMFDLDKAAEGQVAAMSSLDLLQEAVCNVTKVQMVWTDTNPVSASAVSQALCQQPSASWYNNLVSLGLGSFDIITLSSMLQGYFFTHAFSGPRQNPPISTLDWSSFSSHLEGLLTELGIPISNIGGKGQPVINQVGMGTLQAVISAIDVLRFVDPKISDPKWDDAKRYIQMFSGLVVMTNNLLDNLTVTNSTLKLMDLYPNPDEVVSIVQALLDPESAAEFITASVNADQLQTLLEAGSLKATVCDQTAFESTFRFGDAINSTAVGLRLCEAAISNSTLMDRLLSLMDMQSIIQAAVKMSEDWQNHRVPTGRDFWDFVKGQLTKLKGNIEKLLGINAVDGGGVGNLTDVSHLLSNTQLYSQSCNVIITMLDQDYYRSTMKPVLTVVMSILRLVQEEVKFNVDFENIVCDLPGKNLAEIVRELSKINMFELIDKFMNIHEHMKAFDCGEMAKILTTLIDPDLGFAAMFRDIGKTTTCLGGLFNSSSQWVEDVDSVFDLMSNILVVLQDKNVVNVTSALNSDLKTIIPYVELFLKAILGQQEVVTSLSGLLNNSTNVTDYLIEVLEFSPQIVENLFESTLNLDIVRLINNSASIVEEILCEPDELAKYLTIPNGVNLTMEELSDGLCRPNITQAIDVIQSAIDLGRIALELSKISAGQPNAEWYKNLATHIASLMTRFEDLSKAIQIAFTADNINMVLPEIQKFLQRGGPDKIIEAIDLVIEDFRNVSTNPTATAVIDTLQIVNRGMLASDVVGLFFIPTIEDLLEDPQAFREYMIHDLHFTPDVADAILQGSVAFQSETLKHNLSVAVCDSTELSKVLLLNTTWGVKMPEISRAVCQLDAESLANFTSIAFKQLSVKDLLERFFTFSAEEMLSNSGLELKDAEAVFRQLQVAQEDLREASIKLENISVVLNLANLLPSASALSSGGIDAASALLCGKVTDMTDTFQLASVVSDDEDDSSADSTSESPAGVSDGQDGFSDSEWLEINDMPTPFCKDVLKSVYKSSGSVGGILWTYLKPLLRGKIPFYPNNSVTQQIIKKANSTFEMLYEVNVVAHRWVSGSEDLKAFVSVAKNMDAVKTLLSSQVVSQMMEKSLGVSGQSINESLTELGSVSEEQLGYLQQAANLLANFTDCLNYDRWEGMDNDTQVFLRSLELLDSREMMAAIKFDNTKETGSSRKRRATEETNIPKNVIYSIRMDLDNVPSTTFLKQPVWRPVPEDSFAEDLRYLRGFVQLQDMIDHAIIELHTGSSGALPSTYLKQIPFECHEVDEFLHYLSYYLLPLMMTLAWVGTLGMAIKILLYDRERGLEETLKVMGLKGAVNWLAWFSVTMLFMMLVGGLEVVILKVSAILRFSNWLILLLFIGAFCFSSLMMCFMVSAFFTRANMAALSSLIVYLLSYLPFVLVTSLEQDLTFTEKLLCCLSSTTGFGFGCQYMSRFEEQQVGIQWSNAWQSILEGDTMNFAWAWIMMMVDGVVYLIIGSYVRNIIPRKYGVPLPWYYPVLPRYWGCGSSAKHKAHPRKGRDNGLSSLQLMEQVNPAQSSVGISLQNLSKIYSGIPAVDQLSVDFFKGQITSLLGHNGAGKTTTINMLTGVTRPSSGNAILNGMDIYTDLNNIRKDIGICPQHNCLFDFMTVKEHLELFIGLKGNFSGKSAKDEVNRMLESVDLFPERHVPVDQLSGGMKRRLCVALAFVGGSETVILDEPTSGVDPSARRGVWDVILHNRYNRTILLSTHHLDEADILSDRIAILHDGRLLCYGSPMFLKKNLGSGYQLTVSGDPESSSQSSSAKESNASDKASGLMDLIREYVPQAQVQEEMGSEVKVSLMATDSEKQRFHRMFMDIDEHKSELGLTSYGVSETTLEEVFLKACYLADHGKPFTEDNLRNSVKETPFNGKADHSSNRSTNSDGSSTLVRKSKLQRSYGFGLMAQQFRALWLKRFHHYRRDWRLLITLVILPMIFVATSMGFALVQKSLPSIPALVLTPPMYGPQQYAFLKQASQSEMFDGIVEHMTSDPGFGTTCMDDMRTWEYESQTFHCEANPDQDYTAAVKGKQPYNCSCQDSKFVCTGDLDLPPQRLTPTGMILQDLGHTSLNKYLLESYSNFTHNRYGGWSFEAGDQATVWFNNKGHHSLPAYLNTLSNAVLRARLNTSNPQEYGITTINHPYRLTTEQINRDALVQKAGETGIAAVILVAFSFISASFIIYVVEERMGKEKHLQHMSGVNGLTYWTVALVWDFMVFVITVGLAIGIIAIFQLPSYWARDNLPAIVILLLLYGLSSTTLMYMTTKLFSSAATAYMTLFCLNVMIGILTTLTVFMLSFFQHYDVIGQVHDVLRKLFLIFPQYCLGEGLIQVTRNQLITDLFARFREDVYRSPYQLDFLGGMYIALGLQAVVFFIITLLTELRGHPLFRRKVPREKLLEDDDVKAERQRVLNSKPSDHAVAASNLSKLYLRGLKKIVAVDNVTFAVQSGECFGLLGVNGAGKTSIFKMLIGDTPLSGGSAYLNGASVKGLTAVQRQSMGYCPQEDALDGFVSGRELLYCHARLKGTSSSDAKQMVSALSVSLDMDSFLDRPTKTYSGGMKRKLSLAIAVLGRPDVLYLDEPTAGMDPGNKRLVWNLVSDLVKGGTSVILTSHSMAECDVLCNRLAIMVNGRFVCMGSPQHLKHKFSDGYRVIIKVKGQMNNHHDLIQFMFSTFPGTSLKDQHHGMLEFAIPMETAILPNIFGHLERQKLNLQIEDYSVQQTTLDAVFLHFAKSQTDGLADSPEGSVTEADIEVSKSHFHPHVGLSGPFVNESYAFMNPHGIELRPTDGDGGYYSKNISVSRQSSQRSEKGKLNPLFPMIEADETTHL